ncbi:MAG: hypothetical protein H0W30_05425 [Gemmatimonadaceae bacterium]|nr:hypothetical protein [Gemmatimonadaceae bacterium]MBA3558023.1 hypothetical protein [Gemmatimonadaceae bacterium]
MKYAMRMAVVAVAGLATFAGSELPAQGARMNRNQVTRMTSTWPMASRDAAKFMMDKYGMPAAASADMLVWGRTGPWKRTAIYRKEYQHNFPGPHTDVMQQWIDFKAPASMYDELAEYDGSVVLERTSGEISARCDKEGANFLALNLANDIVTGKRSVEDARKAYGEQIMQMKAGQPGPYVKGLIFTPPMGTADTDKPVM